MLKDCIEAFKEEPVFATATGILVLSLPLTIGLSLLALLYGLTRPLDVDSSATQTDS